MRRAMPALPCRTSSRRARMGRTRARVTARATSRSASMTRLTASDFHPEVLKLFDRYVHGLITRRAFLDAANRYAVGGASAASNPAALAPALRRSPTGVARRPAHQDPVDRGRVAAGLRQGARRPGTTGAGRGPAAG